jgi:uncharacterized protein (DUF1684 family)
MTESRIRPVSVAATLVALGVMLGMTACGQHSTGSMVSIPPPDGWVEAVLAHRAAKDENFRTDPQTPLLPEAVDGFAGLEYWDPDPAYYFVGPVNLHFQPERFTIVTTQGKERPCEKVGWVGFEIGGRELRLQVYRLLDSAPVEGDPGYFLPFMDGTTGKETYSAGRYVDLMGPAAGPFVLDFNLAYNPLCAYGAPERYICPKTPAENRLPVRIEAGERGFHLTHD